MAQTDAKKVISKTAAESYWHLLEGAVHTTEFYDRMAAMILAEPYFFGPYLEMIDYMQVGGLDEERLSFIRFAKRRMTELLVDAELAGQARAAWTKKEGRFMLDIVNKSRRAGGKGFKERMYARRIGKFVASLRAETSAPAKNLVLMERQIDVSGIKKEIAENEICWVHDTSRQDGVRFHKDTNTITLRGIKKENRTELFNAVDGPHESERSSDAERFPLATALIERFAADLRGGLGRVVLVRLKPHSIVYRHYDSEEWLTGRNRYHLVIQSTGGSFMTSGSESKVFREGDIFLFNNHIVHTAENNSPDWRIHAIFDMRVPKKGARDFS